MLRSSAWLDLSTGPVVISTPDTHGRLYTLSVLDMWTDIFAVLGKRTTGTARGNHAIVPPGWTGALPRGMHRIDAPTAQVQARLYVQTGGSSEYPGVHAVQDGFILTRWPNGTSRPSRCGCAPTRTSTRSRRRSGKWKA